MPIQVFAEPGDSLKLLSVLLTLHLAALAWLQLSDKSCVTGLAISDAMSLFPPIEFTFAGGATGKTSS